MTKTKKAKSPLVHAINSQLSLTARAVFKDEVMVGLDISETTYYRYLRQPELMNEAERQYIAALLNRKPSEIF